MFDAEKLLGGLISGGTKKSSGLGGNLLSSGAALGLIAGVAVGAAEHFMEKAKPGAPPGPAPVAPPVPPSASAATAPPPPPGGETAVPPSGPAAAPPPPPGTAPASVPPAETPAPTSDRPDAVLLIRAMIAAANADGEIDEQEHAKILGRLEKIDMSPEERRFIVQELQSPADLNTIVSLVTTPRMARQVYAAALLAIEVDTDQERTFMRDLAGRTGLDDATVAAIHQRLEIRQA